MLNRWKTLTMAAVLPKTCEIAVRPVPGTSGPLARSSDSGGLDARPNSFHCLRKNHQTAAPIAVRAITPRINRTMKWATLRARINATMPTTAMTAIEPWEKRPVFNCSIMSILVFAPVYVHVFSGPAQVEAVLALRKRSGYPYGMIILTNTGGVAMTNCYLIADELAKQAVLFDAPDHTTEPLLKEAAARGWDLIGLWLTHGHFDHLADHAVVRQRFPAARILLHTLDGPKAEHPD